MVYLIGMKKTKTLLATGALVAAIAIPAFLAHAQEVVTVPADTQEATVITTDDMRLELADLKLKEKDPSVGTFSKFILRLKIRQLENQLRIKEALK